METTVTLANQIRQKPSDSKAKKVFTLGNTLLLGALGGGGMGAVFSFTGAIWGGVIGILATGLPEFIRLVRQDS